MLQETENELSNQVNDSAESKPTPAREENLPLQSTGKDDDDDDCDDTEEKTIAVETWNASLFEDPPNEPEALPTDQPESIEEIGPTQKCRSEHIAKGVSKSSQYTMTTKIDKKLTVDPDQKEKIRLAEQAEIKQLFVDLQALQLSLIHI